MNETKPTVRQEQSITAGMSREQIGLIKATVARGASDDELKLFLYTANRNQLDPLTKQIHFIKRRVFEDAVFDAETETHPNKATVTVYRMVEGVRVPFTASARWAEYVQANKEGQPVAMWKKMPYLMLAKVAEALALRKAFPNDLSGVYTNEEMAQAESETPEPVNYKVERVVPASDDEAGGSTIRQEVVQQDILDAQKDQIRDFLKTTLNKPSK
jgi:RecT family